MRKASHLGYLARVDQFVDDKQIVEAEELFLKERRVNVGMVHEIILDVLAGASGNSYTAEIEREEGIVAEVVHLDG